MVGWMERRRNWWGWGWEDEALSGDALASIGKAVAARLNLDDLEVRDPPSIDDLNLRAPRVEPSASLSAICSSSTFDRASHTFGKSFRDVVRAVAGQLDNPPDVVAFPRTDDEVVALLEWCGSASVAAIPYGGGSSVVPASKQSSATITREWCRSTSRR